MENEAVVRNWGEPTHEQINNAPRDHLHIATVISQCNFLHGKILTIIDASFTGTQNKAVKDLVRKSFREQMDWMAELSDPYSRNRSFPKGNQSPRKATK